MENGRELQNQQEHHCCSAWNTAFDRYAKSASSTAAQYRNCFREWRLEVTKHFNDCLQIRII